MTKAKFKIGDTVKVKNFGQTYTTYEDMFELMGFKDTRYNGGIKNKDVGTIFGVQLHENQDVLLYAIRTADDREALIGEEGLIKVEDATKMYSEEEVLRIITSCKEYLSFGDEFNEKEWFEKVKKK